MKYLLIFSLACILVESSAANDRVTVRAADARLRHFGNLLDDGRFSFWTNGFLGDWFVGRPGDEIELTVSAHGHKEDGRWPQLAVELIPLDGQARTVGHIPIDTTTLSDHSITLSIPSEFFGIRLRHINRETDTDPPRHRHLLLASMTVEGASAADCGLTEYRLFRQGRQAPRPEADQDPPLVISTEHLRLTLDRATALWSIEHGPSGAGLEAVQPVFNIVGLPVDLSRYEVEHTLEHTSPANRLGNFTQLKLTYRKPGALEIVHTLLVSNKGHSLIAQLDFTNRSDRPITVQRVASIAAGRLTFRDSSADWTAIGDAKRYAEPYQTIRSEDAAPLESWWYLAVKNNSHDGSILLGNLTNNKGLGRFLLVPTDDRTMQIAAYNDYEEIVMPAGATITGEQTLLHFGRRGTDSLDRFGQMVADANGIELDKNHPLDPYTPNGIALFNFWNSYGAGVMIGFPYRHDKKYDAPYEDPDWRRRNRAKLHELGLHEFGYTAPPGAMVRGAPSPLARRYGRPDFWFKEARQIAEAHPEYYIDESIDFSNPAVIGLEAARVREAFADTSRIVRYSWDFTDLWRKLPAQYDPFMTSAETYREAMGIWRRRADRHPPGAYGYIYMNVVGINYGLADVYRAGQDSDQAYYGPGCTFTEGLTRQISGRYFYNGRVWWNNADSFHVYADGLYSYEQAKVHTSFCAITGNVISLGEPFSDQETPADRIEILRRVSPMTDDVARAVDVFEHNPARLWNMPVERQFGSWNVVGLFNVDYRQDGAPITQEIRFEDLGLSSDKEYLVYEFWNKQFLGTHRGSLTRTLAGPDCEIYSVVQKPDRPALISTSRHVRHMAYDILYLSWDHPSRTLSGTSKVVAGDPYQLRAFVPNRYRGSKATVGPLPAKISQDGQLLTVDFTSPITADVPWTIVFQEATAESPH